MWTFGHWGYLHYCSRKAGGEFRCWTLSQFEHSAQLLICSQEREGAALKQYECEPVCATWFWGMVRFEAPFIYQEQCSCQHSYWLLRLLSSVCIGSNSTYSTCSAHSGLWQGAWPSLLWAFLEMMHCGGSSDSWVLMFQLWKFFWFSFHFYCERKS